MIDMLIWIPEVRFYKDTDWTPFPGCSKTYHQFYSETTNDILHQKYEDFKHAWHPLPTRLKLYVRRSDLQEKQPPNEYAVRSVP